MPGESLTRLQEHYPESLISISKMTVMTKEEILEDVLRWARDRNIYSSAPETTI
jgi:hypothetical protein